MASSYVSTQFEAWIEQLKSLVIACAGNIQYANQILKYNYFSTGNDLTENANPDKDFAMLINTKCVEYLTQNRFNIDFRDVLITRKDLLQLHISCITQGNMTTLTF